MNSTDSIQIPVKVPLGMVEEILRKWDSRIANILLKKQIWRIGISDSKAYWKATVIETVWNYCKNRHIDQWGRRESKNRPT